MKTGDDSRAELKFPDQTITRIGSNALFRFRQGGRDMTLDGGTMLFSSPKGAGGGEVRAVGLQGKVLVSFTANPKIRQLLRAGQIGRVRAGATGFDPLPDMALILRIAQSQQGKITGLPDSVVRDVQAAQTARTTIQAGHNPVPKPPMTPPPRPAIVPPQTPAGHHTASSTLPAAVARTRTIRPGHNWRSPWPCS